MFEIKITGDREIAIYIDGVAKGIKPALRKSVRDSLVLLTKAVKDKLNNQVLHVNSGQLRRSIFFEMFSGEEIGGRVGTQMGGTKDDKSYAAIHEFGGTIRPKKGKYLTIPFDGVKGRIEDYPWGFFLRSKKGNLIFAAPPGGGKHFRPTAHDRAWADFTPLFLLKTSVNMPARPYMEPAFRENIPKIVDTFHRHLDEVMNK
jgi:phage gpG-like protein